MRALIRNNYNNELKLLNYVLDIERYESGSLMVYFFDLERLINENLDSLMDVGSISEVISEDKFSTEEYEGLLRSALVSGYIDLSDHRFSYLP